MDILLNSLYDVLFLLKKTTIGKERSTKKPCLKHKCFQLSVKWRGTLCSPKFHDHLDKFGVDNIIKRQMQNEVFSHGLKLWDTNVTVD